jgi:hypothetical protein
VWCATHGIRYEARDYCRRHAGVLEVIGKSNTALPEVGNRAASLTAYLGAALDGRVTAVLQQKADDGAALVNHPVHVITAPGGRGRRWQRSWNLVDSTGVVNSVAIEVDESEDSVVITTVGSGRIGRGTPPWIEHRRGADDLPDRRAAFLEAIGRSIELVLTRPEMARASV